MKRIFMTLVVFALVSCSETSELKPKQTDIYIGHTSPMEVITIDGCQYLFGDWGRATVFTHKGDCNNPIHNSNFK